MGAAAETLEHAFAFGHKNRDGDVEGAQEDEGGNNQQNGADHIAEQEEQPDRESRHGEAQQGDQAIDQGRPAFGVVVDDRPHDGDVKQAAADEQQQIGAAYRLPILLRGRHKVERPD